MSYEYNILTLRAHSGIHNGSGQEYGVVDLPIQRERITNYPVLLGSSLKGALRQWMEDGVLLPKLIYAIFGPENNSQDQYAGALTVGDARLLLFPVRSLKGTFAWTTCHLALSRLKKDVANCNLTADMGEIPEFPQPSSTVCVGNESRGLDRAQNLVVLEEYACDAEISGAVDKTAIWLSSLAGQQNKAEFLSELQRRLVILPDDYFQYFVSFATEVITRTHLDNDSKTVKSGQLWTEELLPAESILVATLCYSPERQKEIKDRERWPAAKLMAKMNKLPGRIQVGGNATVGQGICHTSWLRNSEE